jgi:thioredoxin-related protein
MNRFATTLLALVVTLGVVAVQAQETAADKSADSSKSAGTDALAAKTSEIHWETDYDAALAKAKQAGKPVMIDFYTDWCGWCKVLDKETYTDSDVIDAASKMVALKIDAEEKPELARKYNVTGYPRIVFLSSDGTVMHQIMGYKPADRFLPDMKAVLAGKSPDALVQELMDKGTDDPKEQKWIGMQLLGKDKTREALPYLEKSLAGLTTPKDKLGVQEVLPLVYLSQGETEKAKKAFEDYKANPKADPQKVAETDLRFSFQLKDRARFEAAADRLLELAKDERTKSQIRDLKGRVDELFPAASNDPAGDAQPDKSQGSGQAE